MRLGIADPFLPQASYATYDEMRSCIVNIRGLSSSVDGVMTRDGYGDVSPMFIYAIKITYHLKYDIPMTIDKEIRAVAMLKFAHDKEKLDDLLNLLERTQPQVMIRYNRNNDFDKTCMEFVLGMKTIGYVNSDDKRYVEPLLRDKERCTADFLEVYREGSYTPVVRFLVTVDLDDVEPLRPGEDWEKWEFTFPVIPMLDDLSTVTYAGEMLKDMLTKNTPEDFVTKEELIRSFVKASRFDMSVETSAMYDDILFYLETSRRRNPKCISLLQAGATVRRTDKMRERFLQEWWPDFLNGEMAMRLRKKFAVEVVKKYGSLSVEILKQEYSLLCSELIKMPYSLYEKMERIDELWGGMFYTRIPRHKFLQVLSGLVLYTSLADTINDKKPFIIQEVNNTYIQNFNTGSNAIVNNH